MSHLYDASALQAKPIPKPKVYAALFRTLTSQCLMISGLFEEILLFSRFKALHIMYSRVCQGSSHASFDPAWVCASVALH